MGNGIGFFIMTVNVINEALRIPAKRIKQKMIEIEQGDSNRILHGVIKMYFSEQRKTYDNIDIDSENISQNENDFMSNLDEQTVKILGEIVNQTVRVLRNPKTKKEIKECGCQPPPGTAEFDNNDTYMGILRKKSLKKSIQLKSKPFSNNGASTSASQTDTKLRKDVKRLPVIDENYDTYTSMLVKKRLKKMNEINNCKVNLGKGDNEVRMSDLLEDKNADFPKPVSKNEENAVAANGSGDNQLQQFSSDAAHPTSSMQPSHAGRFKIRNVENQLTTETLQETFADNLLSITLKDIIESVQAFQDNNK